MTQPRATPHGAVYNSYRTLATRKRRISWKRTSGRRRRQLRQFMEQMDSGLEMNRFTIDTSLCLRHQSRGIKRRCSCLSVRLSVCASVCLSLSQNDAFYRCGYCRTLIVNRSWMSNTPVSVVTKMSLMPRKSPICRKSSKTEPWLLLNVNSRLSHRLPIVCSGHRHCRITEKYRIATCRDIPFRRHRGDSGLSFSINRHIHILDRR